MELLAGLRRQGRTLVAVLHDLNQAAHYADVMVALGPDGRIYDQGPPQQVVTATMMQAIFGLACHVDSDPVSGTPRVTPLTGWFKVRPNAHSDPDGQDAPHCPCLSAPIR